MAATSSAFTAEPIAVVGVGCRYPGGVRDLDAFGAQLAAGAIAGPVPPQRWGPEFWDPTRTRPGTTASHVGAFLDDIDRFDPAHFGIAPREAGSLDPQQRLVLEVAWEAMCDSGRTREQWAATRTGVFVGILANDYALLHSKTLGIAGIGPGYAPGTEFSFAAGRLAHAFDLRGPAAAVDTACSSSLFAVHLACQNLRAGECDTAVAGGVNLMLAPELSVFMSRVGAISPTGRCRPFHANADGVIRGDGCGFVILKRLSDAVADQDNVYGVIRGWAVNQDGRSLGVTAPNAMAQVDLHQAVLAHAGLTANDVDFVEAHGTGTPLGDQMELLALSEAYQPRSTDTRPLLIGSSKAVFGHTDAAAGITGLLKALWIVNAGHVPGQPNLDQITTAVDWSGSRIAVPATGIDLPALDRPVRAGVSSFGLSGTNVHVIVESPVDAPATTAEPPSAGPYVLLASASNQAGVPQQVTALREQISTTGRLGDLLASAATRRSHDSHRYAVVAADRESLTAALDDWEQHGFAGTSEAVDGPAPVFVYSGQGGQWPAMAADLYDQVPVVRDTLQECDALIHAHDSWSLVDELRRLPASRLDRTDIAQPAIFAVQVALTRWLTERGIRPAAVLGHSVGEVAAAHIAGCLSLADAVRLIVHRGRILQETAGTGQMLAVHADTATVQAILHDLDGAAVIGAVNGPATVVVSGSHADIDAAQTAVTTAGLRSKLLGLDYAFHSPVVASCGPQLRQALRDLQPATPSLRLLSAVDPETDNPHLDAAYWQRNLTDPVKLWPAVDRLLREDRYTLVEVGPHPVLSRPLAEAAALHQRRGPVLHTLRRDTPGEQALLQTLAQLHVAGVQVDWEQVTGRPRRYHRLPAPSWGGDRYWLPGVQRGQQSAPTTAAAAPAAIRLSMLDAAGKVVGEMLAAPSGPAPKSPTGGATANGPLNALTPAAPTTAALAVNPTTAAPRADLADRVEAVTRSVLGLSRDDRLPRRRGLFEQGMDSLTAVELRTRLEAEFGLPLPATIVFEHPTVDALTAHLIDVGAATNQTAHPAPAAQQTANNDSADDTEHLETDAVAVVGLACRLPGADTPQEFWELLCAGRDAVGELPAARRADPIWAEADAQVPTRGGFLDDVAGFDAEFFRISPREARSLDPQQRLMLEVAWEALEDAGHPAAGLAGRPVGVYLGLNTADYQQLLTRDMQHVDHFYGTGTSFAATAGRISYVLGLRGPSIAVDTACSASLTALHLACQGLRNGDCEVAVVGGANVIVAPTVSVSMSAAAALAPDGRCKTFDDAADGYGRGEGSVALILKPLHAANRDGDRVYAVVRGTAVNQDGASGGMTVPNAAAQVAVIRQALSRAGWAPHEVDYVEAHGTGTPLGDPIEVRALAEALGPGRKPDTPLLIGSAKANLGHLEAAAGVAGLLKAILALHHGQIPPHPLNRPSTRIDWDHLPVTVATTSREWPHSDRPARAGVSAFGFSGSNAHVLIEQATASTPQPPAPARPAPPYVLPITAATPQALNHAAELMAVRLSTGGDDLDDVVYTAVHRRSWLEYRLAAVGNTAADLAGALHQAARGEPPAHVRIGHTPDGHARTVAFWYGHELPPSRTRQQLAAAPDYNRALATCATALATFTTRTPDLHADPPTELHAAYLFCHHVAATMLWAAVGVSPHGVVGHGAGQVAAAWAAGQLGIDDALRMLLQPAADVALHDARIPLLCADAADPATTTGQLAARATAHPAGGTEGCAQRISAAHLDTVVDAGLGPAPLPVDAQSDVHADDPLHRLALTAADLVVTGAVVTGGGLPRRPVSLPGYPWQRRHHWYRAAATETGRPLLPSVITATSAQAVRRRADQLRALVADNSDLSVADIAGALAGAVAPHRHRAVLLARDRNELLDTLTALSHGEPRTDVVVAAAHGSPRPVLLFPGQGSQWDGMAAELLNTSPVFAEHIRACEQALNPHVDWSLNDVLRAVPGAASLDRVDVVQPALFAVMTSLAATWQAHGVTPAAVVGHSQGEIAAAYIAGGLSLTDAATIVALRSRALRSLSGRGGMASLGLDPDQARQRLEPFGQRLSVAAVNGPESVVVCGDPDALDELVATGTADGLHVRRIAVDYASHSHHVDDIRDELLTALAGIQPRTGQIPFYSTVTGQLTDTADLQAEYWFDNLRRTVQFAPVTRTLLDSGHRVFIEASPHPVLTVGVEQTIGHTGCDAVALGTLRRGDGGPDRFTAAAAAAYAHGVDLHWPTLQQTPSDTTIVLPAEAADSDLDHPSAAETAFWQAVDSHDPNAVADTLGVGDGDTRTAVDQLLPALTMWRRRHQARTTADSWRYRIDWKPVTATTAPSGTWLLIRSTGADADAWHDAATTALAAQHIQVRHLRADHGSLDRAALTEQLIRGIDGLPHVDGVLSFLALDEAAHPAHPDVTTGIAGTLALVQALGDAGITAPLWCATTETAAVTAGDRVDHPLQAQVWGLGRVAGLEHPDRWGGLIDLPAQPTDTDADTLCAALAAPAGEDELAVRVGRLFARRLQHAALAGITPPRSWAPSDTVMITGGTGGVGAHLARWMATFGPTHLVLTSRSGEQAPGAGALRDELTALGARVTIAACDVTDRAALAALLDRVEADGTAVRTVVHAAGVGDFGPLHTATPADLARVLAAKTAGAANLDALCGDSVDTFVLISSIAGVWGSAEHSAYAAGNAYLDAVAEHRRARGLPATSVAWGAWQGGGMTQGEGVERLRRHGVLQMSPQQATAALHQVLDHDETTVVITDMQWDRFAPAFTLHRQRRLLDDLPDVRRLSAPDHSADPAGSADTALSRRLAELGESDQHRLLLDLVRTHAADVLGHPGAETLPPDRAFRDLGSDSVTAVELRNRLNQVTGLRLPATLTFDHPTSTAVAKLLRSELVGTPATGAASAADPADPTGDPADDPIVIVGMACRLPGGVDSPESLWELLTTGGDAITAFPTDRGWDLDTLYDPNPDTPGTSYTRQGGFLHDVADFDASLFGISPREALAMDPQQRLLLETSWELFERAGLDPRALRGTPTGVFLGAIATDYGRSQHGSDGVEGYAVTGSAASVVSGRLAYTYGLEGPAVTVDTACSSSLVAMHLAAQALRHGECTLALAGGVSVMSSPKAFVEFSRQRGLAADGRCKPFAAAADGFGPAEGVAVLLLERLSDAHRNGHQVVAVLRGSAINQDGASNGLTAPNGPSQQRVIAAALARAGLVPDQVDVVEAHGTGTALGDPIEAQALLAGYGQNRPADRPLWLGSVKSNIGHTQAAAGAAGVIKTVLAMQHRTMPQTLHVDEPSPHVDWTAGEVRLLTEPRPWDTAGRPRRAGVSSFGISGTNAHLILEEPPATPPTPHITADDQSLTDRLTEQTPTLPVSAWVITARTETALRAQAARLADFTAARPELDPAGVGLSSVTTRAHLEHRAVVVADHRDQLEGALHQFAANGDSPDVVYRTARPDARLAVMFPGQGAQWAGMGAGLYQASRLFATTIDEICAHLDPQLDQPLRDVLFTGDASPDSGLLDQTLYTQTGLFAVEVATFRLLQQHGVRPDFLLGHSIGELAAAHVAGMLSLPDACALVAARAQLMQQLPPGGAMVSLQASEDEVAALLAGLEQRVSIAAVNGPTATVIAGDEDAVQQAAEAWQQGGGKARRLRVSHAFHSPRIESMLQQFRQVADQLSFNPPQIPIVSNVTGRPITVEQVRDPGYWVQHARTAVRFADGVSWLAGQGVTAFLEAGPGGVLSGMVQDSLSQSGAGQVIVPTLRRNRAEPHTIATALAHLFTHGVPVDLTPLYATAQQVTLPTYAFTRERFWLEPVATGGDPSGVGQGAVDHPLIGAAVSLADEGVVLTGRLSLHTQPWLADHTVSGIVLLPGTAFVELAVRAGDEVGCDQIEELTLHSPLPLPERGGIALQVRIGAADDAGRRPLTMSSRPEHDTDGRQWATHASGIITTGRLEPADLTAWPPPGASVVNIDGYYESAEHAGYGYGPTFRGLRAAWRRGDEVFAQVALPEHARAEAARFGLHPALLDAATHVLGLGDFFDTDTLRLPFAWNAVSLHAAGATELRVRLSPAGPDTVTVDVADSTGRPVLHADALVMRPVSAEQLRRARNAQPGTLLHLDWVEAAPQRQTAPRRWVVLGADPLGIAGISYEKDPAEAYLDLKSLRDAVDAGQPAPDMLVVTTAALGDSSGEQPPARVRQVLTLLQDYLADPRLASTRLVLATRNAVSTSGNDAPSMADAAVWGLVRSAQSEHPDRVLLVDFDGHDISTRTLPTAVNCGEPQVAVRHGRILAPRLTPSGTEELTPPTGVPWRLTAQGGTVDAVTAVPCPKVDEPLQAGQVRIAVRAAGVNFRDALIALNLYPGESILGSEGSGIVVQTGPGVTAFTPGDAVMGLIPHAFGPLAVTDHRLLVPVPPHWSFEQAASVPVAFLTAFYGLFDLGQLKTGQSVLVHAAAGGVGMAAVQLAQMAGAVVFGTASEPKWDTLRSLGLDDGHIASSRTTDFAQKFQDTTDGRGVDVVLNSLAGPFVDASARLLVRGGQFIEMGKTDLRDPQQLANDHTGVTYQTFDLTQATPERIGQMLAEIVDLIEHDRLRPLPVTNWDIRQARQALRHISQARHTGKMVLTVPAPLDRDGTVLVTGGTGTLGALVARRLVTHHGVRHLVLASRRGMAADGADTLLAELSGLGAQVSITACDIADRDAATRLLNAIPAEHPLTAVVHTAGVLADATIASLTDRHVQTVWAPKAAGALNLHELTATMPLAAFIMFSSAAGVLGSPGQGNYSAANTFLDALATHRRAHGLPATSIAWGLWAPSSAMTEHLGTGDHARMSRSRLIGLTAEQGLQLFDTALAQAPATVVAAHLDTTTQRPNTDTVPAVLRALVRLPARPAATTATDVGNLTRRLSAAAGPEQRRILLDLVRVNAAAVLGHANPAGIDAERGFLELGLDSLTAVELRNRLTSVTGLRLPATLVFDYPTPAALADYLHAELVPPTTSAAASGNGNGSTGHGVIDAAEAQIRQSIASIPLARFRQAGLLDVLLQLADHSQPDTEPGRDGDVIDAMDVAELVSMAHADNGHNDEGNPR
ncbi:SDR family NAD(P)-dependent oxidoreductase [Micromonospora sp. NPDC085948]|uniref:SDR family NAD(P)-dependent oxidoreductase n=1 Tax=Micromonospora sp. NPDC085948 TaxID=3155293 RepID=UPI0034120B77